MMRKFTLTAFAVTLVLAANSVYGVTINVSGPVTIDSALEGIVGQLDVYQVTIESESDANVTAIDLQILGIMAQAQADFGGGPILTPLDSDVSFGDAAVAQDSHFLSPLTLPGPPVPAPTEGVIADLEQFKPYSGFAQDLFSSQAAISATAQAPSVHIAQVVLAPGTFVDLVGFVAIQGDPNPVDVGKVLIGIPEPSTMLMAGICMIGLVAARRRRVC